jgi:hypothetical protein
MITSKHLTSGQTHTVESFWNASARNRQDLWIGFVR